MYVQNHYWLIIGSFLCRTNRAWPALPYKPHDMMISTALMLMFAAALWV